MFVILLENTLLFSCAYGRNETIDPSKCKIIVDKAWPSLSRTLMSGYDFTALSPNVFELYHG